MDILSSIRTVPDFPKPGILFFDITTLFQEPAAFKQAVDELVERFKDTPVDRIAGIESRGFLFASAMGYLMDKGVILVRKPGKLPGETIGEEYSLEYGTDAVEMHTDAVTPGMNVLVVDDLLATGGTAAAACRLVEKAGGTVAGVAFLIELTDLNGREKLAGHNVVSLLQAEEE